MKEPQKRLIPLLILSMVLSAAIYFIGYFSAYRLVVACFGAGLTALLFTFAHLLLNRDAD